VVRQGEKAKRLGDICVTRTQVHGGMVLWAGFLIWGHEEWAEGLITDRQ